MRQMLIQKSEAEVEFIHELWVNIEREVREALKREVIREFTEGREFEGDERGSDSHRQIESVG